MKNTGLPNKEYYEQKIRDLEYKKELYLSVHADNGVILTIEFEIMETQEKSRELEIKENQR